MGFFSPKKLDNTTLEESGCFNNLYYLVAAQISSVFIHPLSRTQSVRPSNYNTNRNNM